jgi:16S rRNA (guanine966-N2)-methyltransferase
VFDILGSLGGVEGAEVIDLFAGSGAMGIEALSRGAARATFVESDPSALSAIRDNLALLEIGPARARVVAGDAVAFAANAGSAGLVFADPPYEFRGWGRLMDGLMRAGFAGLAVLESPVPPRASATPGCGSPAVPGCPPGWQSVQVRRYGATLVQVVRNQAASQPRGLT